MVLSKATYWAWFRRLEMRAMRAGKRYGNKWTATKFREWAWCKLLGAGIVWDVKPADKPKKSKTVEVAA